MPDFDDGLEHDLGLDTELLVEAGGRAVVTSEEHCEEVVDLVLVHLRTDSAKLFGRERFEGSDFRTFVRGSRRGGWGCGRSLWRGREFRPNGGQGRRRDRFGFLFSAEEGEHRG